MSEVTELKRALAEASAAMAAVPGADAGQMERVAREGAAAVRTFRRFDAHPLSLRPASGTGADPLRDLRHDVRSAAQTVLAQLDMISLAWASWDAAMRSQIIDDLEDSERRLEADVDRCITRAETG